MDHPLKTTQKSVKRHFGPKLFIACGALKGASPRGPCLTAQNRLPWASPSYPSPLTPRRNPGGMERHHPRSVSWVQAHEGHTSGAIRRIDGAHSLSFSQHVVSSFDSLQQLLNLSCAMSQFHPCELCHECSHFEKKQHFQVSIGRTIGRALRARARCCAAKASTMGGGDVNAAEV